MRLLRHIFPARKLVVPLRPTRGFAIAPILYLLGLIGVGAGVLFSGYSQILRTNQNMSNTLAAKNDLQGSATTLAASSWLSTDQTKLCPPMVGSNSPSTPSTGCSTAPGAITVGAAFTSAVASKLPANYATVSSAGNPVEVGVFGAGSGAKVLDPWGHYYLYCRWENSIGLSNALMIISAGPSGKLQTTCGSTTAGGDNLYVVWTTAVTQNHAAVWQTTVAGSSVTGANFGATGSQVNIDTGGDVSVPGKLGVTGVTTLGTGGLTVSGTSNLNGGLTATTGYFTGGLTGSTAALTGALTGTSATFTGALTAGTSTLSSVTVTNNASVGGNFSVAGTTYLAGVTQTGAAVNIGTATAASGTAAPLLSVGKPVSAVYPFSVDQYGDTTMGGTLTAAGASTLGSLVVNGASTLGGAVSVNNTLSVSGATTLSSTLGVNGASTLSSTLAVGGAATFASTLGVTGVTTLQAALAGTSANFSGTVTAANFSGSASIGGGGGGLTLSGVLPIANGGTGGSTASAALSNLFGGAGTLSQLIPGADLVNNSVTSAQLAATGVTAGTYTQVTVTADGRVTSGGNSSSLSDGAGDGITAGTSTGLVFTSGGSTDGNWTASGLMVGSSSPAVNKLDVWGATAIGTGYAGVKTAPANGLIVQGQVAIGTSTANGALNVNGTINSSNLYAPGSITGGSFYGNGAGLTNVTASSYSGTLGASNGGTGTSTVFTQGSVVFAGASGVYSQNNANLFWDNTNYKLGIGTAAPGSMLAVNGGAVIGGYASIAAPANGLIVSGAVGIGTASPNSGSILDLSGATNSLLLPKGTTGQQPAAAVTGMIRYNTTTSAFEGYSGATPAWGTIGGASALASLTDVTLSSPAANQALVYNGTKWVNTTIGTNSVGNAATTWAMIASTDIASAATSYTFSGLNGDTDIEYQIVARFVGGSGSATAYYAQPNADTTAANYGFQQVYASGSSPSGQQVTSNGGIVLGYTGGTAGQLSFDTSTIYAKSGYTRSWKSFQSQASSGTTTSYVVYDEGTWNNTASVITSLQIQANQTNGLGVGTHLELWAQRNIGGSASAGGSNKQVQFNNNGVVSGDSGFTYAGSSGVVSIAGTLGIGTATPANTLDVFTGGLHLGSSTPTSTANALYAVGTSLMWNGAAVGGSSGILAASAGGTGTNTVFTPGSVVFAGASGVYNQNNANFFWDNTNNRLGIGTAAPSSFFSVGSDIKATSDFSTANAAQAVQINNVYTNTASGLFTTMAIYAQEGAASNSSSQDVALQVDNYVPSNVTVNVGQKIGLRAVANSATSGTSTGISGAQLYGYYGGTSTANNLYGAYDIASNLSTGTVTKAYGTYATANNSSTGTVTNAYGVYGNVYNYSSSAPAMTNAYAGYFDMAYNSGPVTNGYGVYIGSISGTNAYGIYDSSGKNDYFSGNVVIGTTVPVSALTVNGAINNVTLGANYQSLSINGGLSAASIATGYPNIAIGVSSLAANTTGSGNVALGLSALAANTTGSNNYAFGPNTLLANTTGTYNTATGGGAIAGNTTGNRNTAVGASALASNTTSSYNTAIGDRALYNATGSRNVGLGESAGGNISSGSNNIVIDTAGDSVTGLTTGSNNISIGNNINLLSSTGSNQLDIGNLIFATGLGSGNTLSTGFVGIGTATPSSLLHTYDSAAKTAAYTGVLHGVYDTSGTASVNKVGMDIESTGTWNGTSAVNTGLAVNATGGTTNYAATFNGGNVGIGTATPAYALDVVGNLQSTNSGSGVFLNLADTGTSSLDRALLNLSGSGNAVTSLVNWNSGGGNTTLVNVPLSALLRTSAGVTGGVIIDSIGTGAPMIFGTGGSAFTNERMRITSAGLVGIGTTTPQSSLDVAGGVAIGTSYAGITAAPTGGAIIQGNVGIGTNNPGYALDVNGAANFRSTAAIAGTLGVSGVATFSSYAYLNNLVYMSGTPNWAAGNYLCLYNNQVNWGTSCSYSDIRVKRDIHPLENSLEKIVQLRGVSFYWKDTKMGTGKNIGLIAQEVEKVFPEAVGTNSNGLKNLQYDKLVAPVIDSIKALKAEIDAVVAAVAEVKKTVDAYMQRNDQAVQTLQADNDNLRRQLSDFRKEFDLYKAAHTGEPTIKDDRPAQPAVRQAH